jgi:membrane protein implicated in regulation of membrane protease activity
MIALIVLVLGFFIVVVGSLMCFAVGLVFPLFYVFTIILGLTSIAVFIKHAWLLLSTPNSRGLQYGKSSDTGSETSHR